MDSSNFAYIWYTFAQKVYKSFLSMICMHLFADACPKLLASLAILI